MSVHTGSQRRIIKMVDQLHDMPPKQWFGIYGAALLREVRRKEDARSRLQKYNEVRQEWRRNG